MAAQEDVVNQVANGTSADRSSSLFEQQLLQQLSQIYRAVTQFGMSQSAARDYVQDAQNPRNDHFQQQYRNRTTRRGQPGSEGFLDSFEHTVLNEVIGDDFKRELKGIGQEFAGQLGLDLNNLSGSIGKKLGKVSVEIFKQTDIGKAIAKRTDRIKRNLLNELRTRSQSVVNRVQDPNVVQNAADRVNQYTQRYQDVPGNRVTRIIRMGMQGAGDAIQGGARAAGRGFPDLRSMWRNVMSTEASPNSDAAQSAADAARASADSADAVRESAESMSNASSEAIHGSEHAAEAASEASRSAATSAQAGEAAAQVAGSTGSAAASEALGAASSSGVAAGAAAAAGSAAAGTAAAGTAAAGTAAAGAAGTAGAAGAAAGAVGAAGGAAAGIGMLNPYVLAAIVAIKIITKVISDISKALNSIKGFFDKFKAAANRDQASREKNLQLAKERMTKDYETLVEEPFRLLKEAAQSVYDSWNSNLRTISATQGYTKADVQDLMAAYASRLRDEGLSSYINSADLTNNLTKVLQSGMSGKIAEEFAYQATKLGAAVPTEDFFGYAETYASIAANAMQAGKSQTEAIAEANDSLVSFASGLLYASRELTGGFTTGLHNASSIYAQATKIAQAAKTDNASEIAGVLVAAQGYIGATAPDLATTITDTIYKALTGGNASDIVALRSLAGVNASNTEFLRAFARNPQKIFAQLFENLARMYSDSSDAYMEKAEGYAQLFGLSSEAFQRIDFSALSAAISEMNVSNASIEENLTLLRSGQTTTNAEQLKAQQINKYMIEEGLAYVIDNQAAQLIQQHMWDEQLARELMEAKYSVELKGAALDLLETLKSTVSNILDFLNPFSWLKKIGNAILTAAEADAQEADVRQLLQLGKVGQGNTQDLYNLTTRNANLKLTTPLVDMLGGSSNYAAVSSFTQGWNKLTNSTRSLMDLRDSAVNYIRNTIDNSSYSNIGTGLKSAYHWTSISKSESKLASAVLKSTSSALPSTTYQSTRSAGSADATASASANKARSALDKMLADTYLVDQFVKKGKSYQDWAATASRFGISDFEKAVEAAGYSKTDLEANFKNKETQQGVEETNAIREHEKKFRNAGIKFWTEDFEFPSDFKDPLFEHIEEIKAQLGDIYSEQQTWREYYRTSWIDKGWAAFISASTGWPQFIGSNGLFNKLYNEFMKRFIENTYYTSTYGYRYSDVEAIQTKSKQAERGDTVYALAEMLTKNLVDLKDPTIQTNALLSQILIVVNAIMNQNNEVSNTGFSFMDTLSSMALGGSRT